MKTIRYKILRRDDWQVFGPFTVGELVPKITGAVEYLLSTTINDHFGIELWECDRVSFTSDEGFGGDDGQIVWNDGMFSIKSKHNATSLNTCRFIKRLGSIYDNLDGEDTRGLPFGGQSKSKEIADGG